MSEFGLPGSFGEGGRPAHQVFEPGPGVIEINGTFGPETAVGHFNAFVGGSAGPDSQPILFTPGAPLPMGVVGALATLPPSQAQQYHAWLAASRGQSRIQRLVPLR